eukprot:6523454-Pyramimonas_sp.AAC.1
MAGCEHHLEVRGIHTAGHEPCGCLRRVLVPPAVHQPLHFRTLRRLRANPRVTFRGRDEKNEIATTAMTTPRSACTACFKYVSNII